MSKSTLLYVVMLVVFVVGLWAIVHVGRSLKAPHDVSGAWVLAGEVDGPGRKATIAQSGRFVTMTVDGGPAVDLVLQSQAAFGSGERLVFKGRGQEVTIDVPPARVHGHAPNGVQRFPDDVYHVRLDGPMSGAYQATRDTSAARTPSPTH